MKIDLPMAYKVEHIFGSLYHVTLPANCICNKVSELFNSQLWVHRSAYSDVTGTYDCNVSDACAASKDDIINALSQLCEYIINGYEEPNADISWDELTTPAES